MAGYTPFTSNYRDLSDENGYQFEFVCDICGSGYRSEFQRSALGSAGSVIEGASSMLGGLWGAANATRNAKDFMDRGARDEALKKAADELMPNFTQCPRDHRWVDDKCWNEARGLCVADAPKLASEMEAERAQVEIGQMRQAMQKEQIFTGDTSARATVCASCGKPVGSEKFCSNCGTPPPRRSAPGAGPISRPAPASARTAARRSRPPEGPAWPCGSRRACGPTCGGSRTSSWSTTIRARRLRRRSSSGPMPCSGRLVEVVKIADRGSSAPRPFRAPGPADRRCREFVTSDPADVVRRQSRGAMLGAWLS
jgi:hypothetical protein